MTAAAHEVVGAAALIAQCVIVCTLSYPGGGLAGDLTGKACWGMACWMRR